MLSYIKQLDFWLFTVINQIPHPDWAIEIAQFFTELGTLGVLWVFIGFGFIMAGKEYGKRTFFLVLSGLLATVVINGWTIKNIFDRLRPYEDPYLNHLFFWDTGWMDSSFMSGHAVSSVVGAVIIGVKYPSYRYLWYVVALLISFSRIYLGAHFPIDVLAAIIVGIFIAIIVLLFEKKYLKQIKHK